MPALRSALALLPLLACGPAPRAPGSAAAPPPEPQAPVAQAPPPEPWLLTVDGATWVFAGPSAELRGALHLVARFDGRAELRVPISDWTLTDEGLVGTASAPGVTVELRVAGPDPLRVAVAARHTGPATVASLAIELDLPGVDPEAIDRAYRRAAPSPATDAGAYTPKVAWLGPLTLIARAEGLHVARTPSGARVRVVLDEAARHPLHLWSDCVTKADDLPIKRDLSARVAADGDGVVGAFDLVVAPRLPLPSRFPAPYRAALAFTDHADQADAARLGALMFGRATAADPLARAADGRGFAGRGLSMTKTVFPLRARPYPPQLDDPAFLALLDALHARGVEIGPHSASGAPDETARTAEGLALLRRFRPRTWIDHQPNTNCEAVTNRGLSDGPFSVKSALEAEGYRYLWAGYDLPEAGAHLNLFAPERPAAIVPVLHRHPLAGESLWFFHSLWRSWPRARFLAAYSDDALDRLAADRGLHVAHTYLDTHRTTGPLAPWTLLEPIDGGFALRPEADAMFARLQARQERGELWVTGIGPISDHLRAVEALTWTVRGGALHVQTAAPIRDLGWVLPEVGGSVSLDGAPLPVVGDLATVPALPAGASTLVFEPPLGPRVAWTMTVR